MKKIHRFLILLSFSGLLLSCITIEENYVFKADGSGSLEYIIDMTELAEIMKDFEDSNSDKNSENNELKTNIDSLANIIRTIPGIQKVKTEDEEWKQKIAFSFDDIVSLNKALETVSQRGSQWSKNGKALKRTQFWVEEEKNSDEEVQMNSDEILEQMQYIITVKSKKKIKVLKSDKNLEVYAEKKKVTAKANFKEVKNDPGILSFSVKVN